MNRELDVIEAAKEVDKLWRDKGPHGVDFSIACALLSRALGRLRAYQRGEREEAVRERW